jgi:hypothetical protein
LTYSFERLRRLYGDAEGSEVSSDGKLPRLPRVAIEKWAG